MISRKVKLDSIEKVKDFVRLINQFSGDVDLISGHYVVDAKSIMGIFSLDLQKPVTMEIHADAAEDLLKKLSPYLI